MIVASAILRRGFHEARIAVPARSEDRLPDGLEREGDRAAPRRTFSHPARPDRPCRDGSSDRIGLEGKRTARGAAKVARP
jgi:hypothetical protein